ncbi:hypothetical protein POTOM_031322 [Populus tomentosa]|uniref:Uncharacterized protein n=1 Tax=Populus tomentosa TaxID=118781 RepID=A0A8X7ZCF4_POPTO|nr:hypothetical protein POTOM_031322 [Populus tomentosa]
MARPFDLQGLGQPFGAEALIQDFENIDANLKNPFHILQLAAKFRNSGQTCVCANRIIGQEGIKLQN